MSTWKTHRYDLTILERHLDSFGHVNNATYLELLEEARWDLITKGGYGYDEAHARKIGPVILEVTLKFRRELELRERIRIISRGTDYNGRIGGIEQSIVALDAQGEEGALHAHATFKVGLFDLVERKLIQPTPEWLKAIGYEA